MFRIEHATKVLVLTCQGKYFLHVLMPTDTLVNSAQGNRELTKVKVWFTLRAGMVKVGNQGLDDTCACGCI